MQPNHYFDAYGETRMRWIEDPAACGLRLVGYADELARIGHTGWYLDDDDCGETVRGVVYQLPGRDRRARYLHGYADPYNANAACLSCDKIFEGELRGSWDKDYGAIEAARQADRLAEIMAEDERNYQRIANAGFEYRELGKQVANDRSLAIALFAEMRAAAKSINSAEIPTICETLSSNIRSIWHGIQKARKKRERLFSDYGNQSGFSDT